jgi:hypothetical protein
MPNFILSTSTRFSGTVLSHHYILGNFQSRNAFLERGLVVMVAAEDIYHLLDGTALRDEFKYLCLHCDADDFAKAADVLIGVSQEAVDSGMACERFWSLIMYCMYLSWR